MNSPSKERVSEEKRTADKSLQPLPEEENFVQDPGLESLRVGDMIHLRTVVQTFSTRYVNLVSFFDQCFNLEKNLKSICKSAHHHLRNTANKLESTSLRIVLNVWYTHLEITVR